MESSPSSSSPLHLCTTQISSAIINRSYAFFHFTALVAFIIYRLSSFLNSKPLLPFSLLFSSELLLSLIWLCTQAYLWRPVSRTVFPQRLPENNKLPAIDVFICTADPKKEPPFEVMNTVLSAMALDYPPEKLSVYLSDDGGSSLTLFGMRQAYEFGRYWIPFCTRFGISNRCPKLFFSSLEDDDDDILHAHSLQYQQQKHDIKSKYEKFKKTMERAKREEIGNHDHYATVEVIEGKSDNEVDMPLLVYVSREKSSSTPHHFKAGALNVLLRVSGIMTNSPYILVLDCDMYCNDSTSARQAMCFHLDPEVSPSLAFVQFPQKFHNISKSDIYDSQLRTIFIIRWPGSDGVGGPILSGTGFYMKRKALYGHLLQNGLPTDADLEQLKRTFGQSNEYLMSVRLSDRPNVHANRGKSLQEAHLLATCAYEEHTLWGVQVGFLYKSVVEDYFTGLMLHCKGWTSILCDPSRPSFLGSGTTNLNDTLVQNTRWNCGLMEVTMSRFSPLIYGLSRMPLLQTMCYGFFALQPLYCFPLWCFATLPQLYLLKGISIYPKVSSSSFSILAFIFIASLLKHLQEVLSSGGNAQTWWNEQRIWMIKSVTGYTYGTLDAVLKLAGLRKASFVPTNKVSDDGKITLYKMGKFDFRTSTVLLAPIVFIVILNIVSLIGGVARIYVLADRSWDEMFAQIFLSLYIVVVNFPIIEGMFLRKDEGCIPLSVSLLSLLFTMIFMYIGSMVFLVVDEHFHFPIEN
ncbi:cellulose synthase-like protein G2 [Euphorbia lathyris]|uniref:cellulose synthase-like protein G2 n=1 Tax=Euphorbia lathyris TaxID=212925 RepID=UPI003313ADE2